MPRSRADPHGGALSAAIPIGWRFRALAASAIVPPLLEVASFARIERVLATVARIPLSRAPDDAVAARWVDSLLSRLFGPWRFTCLRRTAVLYFLLRSTGRAVDMCIGVRRDGAGKLHAHAWLLRDGALYLESPQSSERVADFRVIARFPQAAPRSA